MTQDQIILLLDLRESKERGAASMGLGQRVGIAEGVVKLKMIEKSGSFGGYRITVTGEKWLEKNRRRLQTPPSKGV